MNSTSAGVPDDDRPRVQIHGRSPVRKRFGHPESVNTEAISMHDPVDLIGDPFLFSHDNRRHDDSPEMKLFAAILEDVRFCLAPASLVDRETRSAAVAWVRGEVDSIALCSFREICEILALDEDATRARLLSLGSANSSAHRRRLDVLLMRASLTERLPMR